MANKKKATVVPKIVPNKNRTYLSQSDVPAYGLDEALRVARAIADNYACQPTKTIAVAQAMNVAPTSGPFRMVCGASIAYGLTEGGYNAATISVTNLGKRILKPTEENQDLLAKREAALKPRVIGEFLKKYDGSKLPKGSIANNVLESMGVPAERCEQVFDLIFSTATAVGFIREIKGAHYVDLQGTAVAVEQNGGESSSEDAAGINEADDQLQNESFDAPSKPTLAIRHTSPSTVTLPLPDNRRVFVTHGKNTTIVPQIKEILAFGDFEAVVSVEIGTVSKPVPDKVMDDMRSCFASIIHVDVEKELTLEDGTKETLLNQNVLIEIGASMALYGRRYILLVRDGVKLPSNLQGLFEVRYTGEKLDAETTIKLMKVFKQIKSEGTVRPQANTKAPDLNM